MMTLLSRVRRVSSAIVLLAWVAPFVSACSDDATPTNPSGVPNAAGVWTGTYRIKTCTDEVNGVAGTLCVPLLGTTAVRQPLRVSLQQTNDQIIGNLEFSGWFTRALIITGTISPDGNLLLSGQATWTETACPTVQNRVAVQPWISVLNRALDGMTGDFTFVGNARVAVTGCVFAVVTIEADTLQLTKQ